MLIFQLDSHDCVPSYVKHTKQPFAGGTYRPLSNNEDAHNPDAARLLKYSLSAYFPGEKFIYIIGVFKDKDYEQILRTTLPRAKRVYTINAPAPIRIVPIQLHSML